MTDPQTLLDQAKCYLCLGVTLGEALQLALLAQIAGGAAPSGAQVYRALVSQSGTNAPTAIVLENGIGTVTFSRLDVGFYQVNLGAPINANKTWYNMCVGQTNSTTLIGMLATMSFQGGVLSILTNDPTGASQDDQLNLTPMEILIYP